MSILRGKTCLITGASSGIGKETALGLARQGADLVLVCRDRARGERARDEIRDAGSPRAELLLADLSVQREVRRVAAEILARCPRLDVFVSNAGAVMPRRVVTEEGYETTLALNHLAPFLLTHLLLDRLKASAPARVVVVASQVESRGRIDFDDLQLQRGYEPLVAYFQSKLANVLFTYELARRLSDTGVTANCLHPGVIATNLLCDYMGQPRVMSRINLLTHPGPKKGAETSIRLASDPTLGTVTGRYFRPQGESPSSRQSHDEDLARRLWAVSERLTCLGQPS